MGYEENPDALPPFLRLAGNELRWRILRELAHSDLRVWELVTRLGEPQSLVSYHLGRLRSAGLVSPRRSSADGRDVYYHLDLPRCAELLTDTADALHPALRDQPSLASSPRRRGSPIRVLFLCTGNSARSPMAAALLRHHGGGAVKAVSAGSQPRPINPRAVRALRDYGIDLARHRPRHLGTYTSQSFDYVISLCDRVREVCPEFPDHPLHIHWSIPDPAAESEDGDGAYRRTAAELDSRIRFLIPIMKARQHLEAPS